MTISGQPAGSFNLERFVEAQFAIYEQALSELRDGRKRSHWMWFIFPQLEGLGRSHTARLYSIKSRAEAEAYLAHPVLGPRLQQCSEAVLLHHGKTAAQIFSSPDDLKLRSCMTLFQLVSPPGSVFSRVLDRYYDGAPDPTTLHLLGGHGGRTSVETCD